MSEIDSSHPSIVVFIGHDGSAAQTVLSGLTNEPGFAIVSTIDAGVLAKASGAKGATSALPIVDVKDATSISPNHVYALPTEVQSLLRPGAIAVENVDGPGHIDRLLRSVADHYGASATVVVLGGRDGDGALGIKRVREAGGLTICQRVEDGPFADLPRAAVLTGLIDVVLPLEEIATRLLQSNEPAPPDPRADDTLRDILAMIRIRTGHDFSWYKRATLYRRLARRMHVCQTPTIQDYHRMLREQPNELTHLLRDFLISVTNFFRDPEAFQAVTQLALPRMFRAKGVGDQVRVWVAGCATGEEAYSLGMLLSEYASRLPEPPQLQVFATDIDEEALHEARAGIYSEQIATDVSRERLERFFTRENGGYRVSKELREMMLFSPHNVLRDPPFSRLDLVTCRNLLIYFNREAQERVLNTFHFALRNEGMLFLGSSESAEGMQQFAAVDAKNRIFERRIAATGVAMDALSTTARWTPRPAFPMPAAERPAIGSFGELHHRAVELYAPPSVLVNEDLDVVHFSEHAGQFLTIAGGEPTRQILRMAHPALRFELRGALYAARQPNCNNDTRVVRFEEDGRSRAIQIRVRAVDLAEAGHGTVLVIFDELPAQPQMPTAQSTDGENNEPMMREMEEDLHRTRDQLRTTVEQYETSLEELKASNEELHAINEELRSATEELETSKEELQSVNEELTTLNHELKVKVDEVSRANSDLQNLMTSTDIGVLFLDRQLNVKRFTPRICELFNLIPSDIGRPLLHITHRLDYGDLPQAAAQVLLDLRTTDREVSSVDGRRFLVRFLPYRSIEDRIDGVVLTFVDITDLKTAQEARTRSEAALRTTQERLSIALAAAPLAVFTHDSSLQVTWAFAQGRQVDPNLAAHAFAAADAERYMSIARDVYASGVAQRAELDVNSPNGVRTFDFRFEPRREGNLVQGVTAVGFDITESKLAENKLRETDRHKDEFIAMLSHELRNPLTPLRIAFDIARRSTQDPKQMQNALSVMDHQLQILHRLVDDLLDLSRVAQGKMQLVHALVDSVKIVEAALESTRPKLDEHHHKLELDLPDERLAVLGDFTRLTQVLTNLLMNSAKYTPDFGHIKLSIRADRAQHLVSIEVRDTGVGISRELLPRVFDLFVQGEKNDNTRQGGLGIGLNLARRIVELHGGKISAFSDGPGAGSVFTVQLPLAKGT
ncbi:MAG TPA: CheR family methyltransferase [Kofleriaceae bacterium]|nr:CheR family methyltransferase [Kofleriaceae bacterium]